MCIVFSESRMCPNNWTKLEHMEFWCCKWLVSTVILWSKWLGVGSEIWKKVIVWLLDLADPGPRSVMEFQEYYMKWDSHGPLPQTMNIMENQWESLESDKSVNRSNEKQPSWHMKKALNINFGMTDDCLSRYPMSWQDTFPSQSRAKWPGTPVW